MREVYTLKGGFVAIACASLPFSSCTSGGSKEADSDTIIQYQSDDGFHADNDILMTVGSLIDAMRVGERLDSTYALHGTVQTDGTGRPLYADVSGFPGEWDLTIEGDSCALLSNTALGDLAVEDLKAYLLPEYAQPGVTDYQLPDHIEMRFNTRIDTTANGITGPMLTIRILKIKDKR